MTERKGQRSGQQYNLGRGEKARRIMKRVKELEEKNRKRGMVADTMAPTI